MKKIHIVYIMVLFAALFTACEEDFATWDQSTKEVLYFDYLTTVLNDRYVPVDSLTYAMPISNDSILEYSLNVGIIGLFRDNDRQIDFEVINDSLTTAVENLHYSANTKGVIKAGEVNGSIPITLYRDRDPLLSDSLFSLHIRLLESEDFRLEGKNDSIVLYFTDGLGLQPEWWNVDLFGSTYHKETATMIMEKFRTMKTLYPSVYDEITGRWGEELQGPYKLTDWGAPFLPVYNSIWIDVICKPVYNWVQDNPQLGLTFKDPATVQI